MKGKLIRIENTHPNNWWHGIEFIEQRIGESEEFYYLTPHQEDGMAVKKSDCTVLSDTQPEPIPFCSRTDGLFQYFKSMYSLEYSTDELNDIIDIVYETSNPKEEGKIIVDTDQDVLDHIMKKERVPFNIGKFGTGKFNVETHIGASVEILKIVNGMDNPIVGVLTGINNGEKVVRQWGIEGFEDKSGLPNGYSDLFLIPKTKTVWVNVYHGQDYTSKQEALLWANKDHDDFDYIETIQVNKPI